MGVFERTLIASEQGKEGVYRQMHPFRHFSPAVSPCSTDLVIICMDVTKFGGNALSRHGEKISLKQKRLRTLSACYYQVTSGGDQWRYYSISSQL
jgi:hypothetical protein